MTQTHLLRQQLIEQLGETDQAYQELPAPDPALAVTRAKIRHELAELSQMAAEKNYLLSEAISILEISLHININDEETTHLFETSLLLAETYLKLYQVQHNTVYLKVSDQILRTLPQQSEARLYWLLALSSAYQQKSALTQHWLDKHGQLMPLPNGWWENPAFDSFKNQPWLKTRIRRTVS